MLAHDPVAIRELQPLLDQKQDLTFIQAERDFLRSYILTAMSHSASRCDSASRWFAGPDVHGVDAYLRVPGVVHLGHMPETSELGVDSDG